MLSLEAQRFSAPAAQSRHSVKLKVAAQRGGLHDRALLRESLDQASRPSGVQQPLAETSREHVRDFLHARMQEFVDLQELCCVHSRVFVNTLETGAPNLQIRHSHA